MTEQPDPESAFLEQLGQRVRTMRALRGMSRKVLAKVSGISERYIAQLESGKGNVSIVLLRRVSDAMGALLEDLIPVGEPSPDWPVIRDLLRQATPNQIAHVKDILSGQGASAQRHDRDVALAAFELRDIAFGNAGDFREHLARHAAQCAHGADTLAELFEKAGFGIGIFGHVAVRFTSRSNEFRYIATDQDFPLIPAFRL